MKRFDLWPGTFLTPWARLFDGFLQVRDSEIIRDRREWRNVATIPGFLALLEEGDTRGLYRVNGRYPNIARNFVTTHQASFPWWIAALHRFFPERQIIRDYPTTAQKLTMLATPDIEGITSFFKRGQIDFFAYYRLLATDGWVPQVCFASKDQLFFLSFPAFRVLSTSCSILHL